VVGLGLVDEEEVSDPVGLDRRAFWRGPELPHPGVARRLVPMQEQPAVGGKAGMEGDAEEALLGPRPHLGTEVEGDHTLFADQAQDPAGLFQDPESIGVARGCADEGGPVEPPDDALEGERTSGDLLRSRRRRCRRPPRTAGCKRSQHEDGRHPAASAQETHTGYLRCTYGLVLQQSGYRRRVRRALVVSFLVATVSLLVVAPAPSYDAWSWLLWVTRWWPVTSSLGRGRRSSPCP
jgi:hypothetical protein